MTNLALCVLLAVLLDEYAPSTSRGARPGDAAHQIRARVAAFATAAVLLPAVLLAWSFEHLLLAPAGLSYLGLLVFLLLVAVLAQLVERIACHRGAAPATALHRLAPRVTAIVLLLGVATLATQASATALQALGLAAGLAAAFGGLRMLFAALRLRLELADVPERLRGLPIALITAGLMALALRGFDGMLPG